MKQVKCAAALSFIAVVTGCGNDGSTTTSTNPPAPPPQATVNVAPCFDQTVVPGRKVADLVVPDVVTLNLNQASGFPNGRKLNDPVVDLTLAAILLDLRIHAVDTFAKIPLNPSGPDVPQPVGFPYLAPPQGGQAVAGGSGFVFRTEAPSAYTRIDRMGEPAVATALVRSAQKSAFNDDNPGIDATGKWVPEFAADLTELTNELKDDLAGLKLTGCATPA